MISSMQNAHLDIKHATSEADQMLRLDRATLNARVARGGDGDVEAELLWKTTGSGASAVNSAKLHSSIVGVRACD